MFDHPDFPRWVRQSHESKCRYIIVRTSKRDAHWLGVPPEMSPHEAVKVLSPVVRGLEATTKTTLYEIDRDGYALPVDFATCKVPVRRTAFERLMEDDEE